MDGKSPFSPAAIAAAEDRVRRALNQRYMLNRQIEREGLKRSVTGVLLFIGKLLLLAHVVWPEEVGFSKLVPTTCDCTARH